jgi:hypothetical protein
MQSLHNLEAIVIVPAPPPDGARTSTGVKRYRKALLNSYFFTPLLLWEPFGGSAETITMASK